MEGDLNLVNEASNPGALMDWAIKKLGVKNDAALAHKLEVGPSVISRIRRRKMPIGASMLLKLHELTDTPARELRKVMLAGPAGE